jgi:hypothetical protein
MSVEAASDTALVTSPLSEFRVRRIAAEVAGASMWSIDDLIDAVMAAADDAGLGSGDRGEDESLVEHVLFDYGDFVQIADSLGHLPQLIDGTRWRCEVSTRAASTGQLPVAAFPLIGVMVYDRPLSLRDAQGDLLGEITLEEIADGEDATSDHLVGPEGWLDGLDGGCIEFAFGPDGSASVAPVDRTAAFDTRLVAAFRHAFTAVVDSEESAEALFDSDAEREKLTFATMNSVATRMLVDSRDALVDVAVAPLDALATECGFETEGRFVAAAGFDWDALRHVQTKHRLAWSWHLESFDAEFLQVLLGASMTDLDGDASFGGPDEHAAAMSMFGIAFERPGVAEGFWGESVGVDRDPAQVLSFVQQIFDGDDGRFGGARWVAARCLDHLGRAVDAETVLAESVGGEMPDHPRAMGMLAGFRSDRGDARGAVDLLRRSDVFDVDHPDELGSEPLLNEVGPFAAHRPKVSTGRNEPCPCGSGKKYKKCHMGTERHAIDDRANWLFTKMARYVRDNRFASLAEELADVMNDASVGAWRNRELFLNSPWLADLVLSCCDAGAAFASERDALLPDDEAILAAQWSLVEPSVFEVRAVTGDSLETTDLRTGEALTVSNLTPHASTRPGTLLYGRPLPVGDTWRALSGFIGIPAHHVETLIEAIDLAVDGDAFELAARLAATFAPPTLTNTSGEQTRFHTQTWSLAGVESAAQSDGLAALLRAAGLHDDGDGRFTLVRDTPTNPNTVIASMRLHGVTLTVECNSDERAAEAIALLLDAVPGIELVDHDYFESEEMMRRGAAGEPGVSLKSAHEVDPEIRALLIAEVARHEREWLDASIPALDGRTPRDCVTDPLGREKLTRLLASFPDTDELTEMSPDRLRNALGL